MTIWTKFMQALDLGVIVFGTYVALRAVEHGSAGIAVACVLLIAATAWGVYSRAARARDEVDR